MSSISITENFKKIAAGHRIIGILVDWKTSKAAFQNSIIVIAESPKWLGDFNPYLPGQIARALAIFNVDEVVIFNDNPGVKVRGKAFEGVTKKTNANIVLARILQYLETPQ